MFILSYFMQVTGGKDRGRKINPVKNPAIRPSKAVVREALFSVLGPQCCLGKNVVDFFSGSGIMTLEALSRGAASAYSIDSDADSCALIRANFDLLTITSEAKVLQMSVNLAISKLASYDLQFDIIFLDPPYCSPQLGIDAIELSVASGLLKPESVVIFEHRSKTVIPDCKSMTIWKQKRYGQSMLSFYRF
ncbi:MAG TPA: 16S rRNA (guanine(966)-N(2))-methyltransferase RsmD [Desulfarculaceae bacterium]|nr:16S rRNA (guanine(966)-N(2))-methyltransferase RsmD [Desulfarculaceae bacterium]